MEGPPVRPEKSRASFYLLQLAEEFQVKTKPRVDKWLSLWTASESGGSKFNSSYSNHDCDQVHNLS